MKRTRLIVVIALAALVLVSTVASAQQFNWQKYKGTTIHLLLSKHPYVDALVADLPEFEKLTGIKAVTDITAEEQYFDKVTVNLSSSSSLYDAFMTGAYQVWTYSAAGWAEALDPFMKNPAKTSPDWDQNDFFPAVLKSLQWDGQAGSKLGTGDAKQWALPWGFEINTLIYRKDILDKYNMKPPKTYVELLDMGLKLKKLEPNMIVFHARGSRSWNTMHPGFMSAFHSYGASDFDSNLHAVMNSPKAVEFTDLFIKCLQQLGPEGTWTNFGPWDITADIANDKAIMMHDADLLGFFSDVPGSSKVVGKLAWAPSPGAPGDDKHGSNIWIWSLAMNHWSKQKDATWLFMQWATGKQHLTKGALDFNHVDPTRQSIWNNPKFLARMKQFPGYVETFKQMVPNSGIWFTPEPLFFEVATEWASTLQDIYANKTTTQEGLDKLASDINDRFNKLGISK